MTLRNVPLQIKVPLALIFYLLFSILYALLCCLYTSFGPLDDHLFLNTILVGKRLPFFIAPNIGRFYPLNGQEYNIISLFSVSPFCFYTFNAIQFLLFSILFFRVVQQIGSTKNFA